MHVEDTSDFYNRASASSGSSAAATALRNLRNKKQLEHTLYLWYFLASVIGFFTFVRVVRYTWEKFALSTEDQPSTQLEKNDSEKHGRRAVRASALQRLAWAVTTGFRITFFRWSVRVAPGCILSMSEITFICIYITVNLVLLFVDTINLLPTMYQDRAALLASSQLSLVVALAGKNNIISWLTGVGHEKLNVLHRASARTLTILLWIHAIQRILSGLPAQFDFSHHWVRAGATGLGALTLAVILSIRPIRNAAFEFFLVAHIVLILIFLICAYYHTKAVEHSTYIFPAFIVWGLDRFLRGCRLVWNNEMWNSKHSGDALVEPLGQDTIRLTLRRRGVTWTPGQHAYVILPTISRLPFEAHPFTISSIPETVNDKKERDLVFLIRGRSGFTGLLRRHASKNAESRVPAFLDGPYGSPPNLRQYSSCILVAGGSGISYTLPLLLDLVSANQRGEKSAVKRVVFVWALRDSAHLKWISEALLRALTNVDSSLVIEPRIYITGSDRTIPDIPELEHEPRNRDSDASSSEKKDDSSDQLPNYSSLKLIHGRPSIKKLIHEEIEAAVGPISVDVAGPSSLAESIRRTLCSDLASPASVLKGAQPVTLHVETFGMTRK
ncbi:ferric reductase NAD binding domain-containing protein [Crepidotus variabilis]|uniref:ferric-chelate reductase (NADPH) n=1 Tax=Crepidotus variabilis TaxID=179855 RepID=A0A9P6EST4_9AGAR|nr:ferric reductase NAD binding domain-containing protein [Crepidotus variabilis]